ncbi:hypothetical protein [Asticcacaulis solisilvae]|uniref:hypothetical protein n=1 Tax=Asticcacaulis solisilvae TaxID=1217274 RepID=UPI003FD79138
MPKSVMEHNENVMPLAGARGTVSLVQLADIIGRSYEWTRENWRSIEGFPPPFIGRGKYQRPRWRMADVRDFMSGKSFSEVAPSANANEAEPTGRDKKVASLLKGL